MLFLTSRSMGAWSIFMRASLSLREIPTENMRAAGSPRAINSSWRCSDFRALWGWSLVFILRNIVLGPSTVQQIPNYPICEIFFLFLTLFLSVCKLTWLLPEIEFFKTQVTKGRFKYLLRSFCIPLLIANMLSGRASGFFLSLCAVQLLSVLRTSQIAAGVLVGWLVGFCFLIHRCHPYLWI